MFTVSGTANYFYLIEDSSVVLLSESSNGYFLYHLIIENITIGIAMGICTTLN